MKKQKKRIVGTSGNSPYIVLTQTQRKSIDIGDYVKSVRNAEDITYPNRVKWYDMCAELLTDAHLVAVIQKRKSAVLSIPIEFHRAGKPDDTITEQLRSPWFYNFLNDALDAPILGFTLVQFYTENGWINYDLIPRKHVNPVKKMILTKQGDNKGESFDNFSDLLFIGQPDDLGLMLAAAPYVIYKRNTLADWAQFSEIFGMPLIEGTYDGYDEEARMKLLNDIYGRGANTALVHPDGTKITLHDAQTKAGSSELYKGFAEFCNAEISKLFLGNTLTTEAGDKGTQALGTVHKSVEERIEETDKQYILNLLNYQMTDIFASLGINTSGGEFTFVVPQTQDLSSRITIDVQLKNLGLPMSDDYFYETYGVEKPKDYDSLKALSQPIAQKKQDNEPEEPEQKKQAKTLKNRITGFFVNAPTNATVGASEWD